MDKVTLGKTGIEVCKNGFGPLPIQRISHEDAVGLLRRAYNAGFRFFDTARFYTDSEEKVGAAFEGIRDKVYIATKTMAKTAADFERDLSESLEKLRTDYIDVYQFHNPPFCPKPGDGTGLYEAALKAKAEGKIRHIGITNHRIGIAREALDSGLYETLQFPFSYLASDDETALVSRCERDGVGFIAMKALAGGLINNSRAAYAALAEYPNVLPIWGIQRERELDEFISYISNPPVLDGALRELIEEDRAELRGGFCRGCGYCMPCPQGIEIPNVARMSLMLRRAPVDVYTTPEWREKMERAADCIHCNKCAEHCPYSLDTPSLIGDNYRDFKDFIKKLDKQAAAQSDLLN